MENNQLFKIFKSLDDFLSQQEWYQQIKGYWESLDATQKWLVTVSMSAFGMGLFVMIVIIYAISVKSMKQTLADQQSLLAYVRNSSIEQDQLDANIPNFQQVAQSEGPWNEYLQSLGAKAKIDVEQVGIVLQENPANSNAKALAVENLFEIQLKKINLRQMMQYGFFLENSQRPVKIRRLQVQTTSYAMTGYLDVTYFVSTFQPAK